MQRRPAASSARRNRRAARFPAASASGHNTTGPRPEHARAVNPGVPCAPNTAPAASSTAPSRARCTSASASSGPSTRCTPPSPSPPAWNTRRPPAKSEAATDGRLPAAPNSTRAPGVPFTGSDARQARPGSGDGASLWPRGRSSRVRPRGAPSRRPARPGVPGTTRYRVSRRSRTSGTRVPRSPRALPTRSNNHGPRRSPDRGRDIHARRAASPPAPVAPRPGRASASRLTRAARGPWAAPTRSPEKPVYDQAKPPLGAPA